MEKQKKRIIEIDVLRGLAATMMILGHSIIVYPVDLTEIRWCRFFKDWIYSWHMEMFFLLAGICFYFSTYKKLLQSKTKRILIPYITFGIVSIGFHAIGGQLVNQNVGIGNGVQQFLLRGGNYWFLYTIFIMYMIFPLFEILMTHIIGIALLIVVSVITSSLFSEVDVFTLNKILWHLPFFVIGYICKTNVFVKYKRFLGIIGLTISSAVFILSMWFLYLHDDFFNCIHFIRSISMIYVFFALINIVQLKGWIRDVLVHCGKYSLQLYLFNGYLLVIERMIICVYLKIQIPIIIIVSIWIIDIAVTLLICKLLEKFKYTRIAVGL